MHHAPVYAGKLHNHRQHERGHGPVKVLHAEFFAAAMQDQRLIIAEMT
jgi:hypothetical protein